MTYFIQNLIYTWQTMPYHYRIGEFVNMSNKIFYYSITGHAATNLGTTLTSLHKTHIQNKKRKIICLDSESKVFYIIDHTNIDDFIEKYLILL